MHRPEDLLFRVFSPGDSASLPIWVKRLEKVSKGQSSKDTKRTVSVGGYKYISSALCSDKEQIALFL